MRLSWRLKSKAFVSSLMLTVIGVVVADTNYPPNTPKGVSIELVSLPEPPPSQGLWPDCEGYIKPGESLQKADSGDPKVWCVYPGVYNGGTFSSSGKSSDRRVLRYYDPENPSWEGNPVKLADNKRWIVKEKMSFDGSYWSVYGLYSTRRDSPQDEGNISGYYGSYLTLDNIVAEYGGGGAGIVQINTGSTINHSVIRLSDYPDASDSHCVVVKDGADDITFTNNEVYDCAGDGFQIHPGVSERVLVQNNDIYQTSPNFVPFDWAEQGLDFKASTNLKSNANGIKVLNNRIVGICNGDGDKISSMVYTDGQPNNGRFLVENNIFDAGGCSGARGVMAGGPSRPTTTTYRGNLFNGYSIAGLNRSHNKCEWYYNTYVNPGAWMAGGGGRVSSDNNDVMCNVVVNATENASMGSGNTADYNAYYNSPQWSAPGSHDIKKGSAGATNSGQFCYQYKQITNPTTRCIKYAKTNASTSPHKDLCKGVNVGARSNIGIDNNIIHHNSAGIYMGESLHKK